MLSPEIEPHFVNGNVETADLPSFTGVNRVKHTPNVKDGESHSVIMGKNYNGGFNNDQEVFSTDFITGNGVVAEFGDVDDGKCQ
jgi:hypothetical protein